VEKRKENKLQSAWGGVVFNDMKCKNRKGKTKKKPGRNREGVDWLDDFIVPVLQKEGGKRRKEAKGGMSVQKFHNGRTEFPDRKGGRKGKLKKITEGK